MSFILKYGNYAHEAGEVGVQVSRSYSYNDKREKSIEAVSWTIDGFLIGTGVGDMKTKINALKAAYALNDKNLILYQSDGVTPTAHDLLTAGALGGVRVQEASFPNSEGPEHLTYRTYRIVVFAEYEIAGQAELIVFNETLSTSGGGPRKVWQESLTGKPVDQTVNKHTVFEATQSGTAVGRTRYPSIPAPLFPGKEEGKVNVSYASPKQIAPGVYREYQVTWEYRFKHGSKMSGLPNKR